MFINLLFLLDLVYGPLPLVEALIDEGTDGIDWPHQLAGQPADPGVASGGNCPAVLWSCRERIIRGEVRSGRQVLNQAASLIKPAKHFVLRFRN